MQPILLTESEHAALRADLEALEGVRHVGIDGPPLRVWLVCDADAAPHAVELGARALLARAGLAAGQVTLEVASLAAPQPRRRVRLVECAYRSPRAGQGVARVTLEWAGVEHRAEVAGESGPVADLRLVVQATLQALEAVVGEVVCFQLVGVKSVRIFDRDLLAVLLHTESAGGTQFAGSALVAGSAHHAACLAVLNATNRVLGNYLAVGE